MAFYDEENRAKISQIEQMWSNLQDLAEMARQYGINDIFQDNGAKVLQQLVYLNMRNIPGREGNDCISEDGTEWEMKSINLDTSATGFSTNHHTNRDTISNFRSVPWAFAIYRGITLTEMYVMTSSRLEPLFQRWEAKLDGGMEHLNNPKIPVNFVREHGLQVFPINPANPIDPQSILRD